MDCVDGGQHVNETEWRQEEETPHVLLAQEELSCGTFILVPYKFVCFFLSGCVPACRHGARGQLLRASTAKALQSQFSKTEEAEFPGAKPPGAGDTQHPAVPLRGLLVISRGNPNAVTSSKRWGREVQTFGISGGLGEKGRGDFCSDNLMLKPSALSPARAPPVSTRGHTP